MFMCLIQYKYNFLNLFTSIASVISALGHIIEIPTIQTFFEICFFKPECQICKNVNIVKFISFKISNLDIGQLNKYVAGMSEKLNVGF